MLKQGSKGEDVKRWQEFLRKAGFDIVADGIFGKATDRATRSFQIQNGLREDGIVGKNTLAAAELETPSETPEKPKTRQLSDAGIAFIKSHEGAIYRIYLDPIGLPTGGIGHLLTAQEKKEFPVGTVLSKTQVDEWFRFDIKRFERSVNDLVKVPLTQNQFDALVSFAFNVGTGNFGKSSLLRYLNKGEYSAAANEFRKWNKAGGKVLPGLTRRRKEEMELFLN